MGLCELCTVPELFYQGRCHCLPQLAASQSHRPRPEGAAAGWDLLRCVPGFISFILYFALACLFLRILTAVFYYFTIRDFEGGSIKEVRLKYLGCSQLSHLSHVAQFFYLIVPK